MHRVGRLFLKNINFNSNEASYLKLNCSQNAQSWKIIMQKGNVKSTFENTSLENLWNCLFIYRKTRSRLLFFLELKFFVERLLHAFISMDLILVSGTTTRFMCHVQQFPMIILVIYVKVWSTRTLDELKQKVAQLILQRHNWMERTDVRQQD